MTRIRSLAATLTNAPSRLIAPVLFLVVVIAVWEFVLLQGWVADVILPRPTSIASSFVTLLAEPFTWDDIWATTYETVVGFLLAAALGFGLAVMCGLSTILRNMLYPYTISLQVTPRIAIAPVIIAWFGFGYSSKIVVAALVAFFPVFLNTLTGITTVDEDAKEMFRSLGANRRQTFVRLMLPSSLPVIFAGLKAAMTLALIGAIVGEFISAQAGLGVLIKQFSYQLAVADAFAVLLMLTVIGLILYAIMLGAERVCVFWSHDDRLAAKTRRRAAQAENGRARSARRRDVTEAA